MLGQQLSELEGRVAPLQTEADAMVWLSTLRRMRLVRCQASRAQTRLRW